MSYITCEQLTVGYEGHAVLTDVSLSVSAGDYLVIVGENGSGKTTLMKTILGLQKPLAGAIRLGGGLRQNEIGYLPQQTAIQKDFPATVREVVLSGCQARLGRRPFYRREDRELARLNIERMNLTELERKCYRNLSGGQQQRVLLARALCASRKVLVLDEPVAGLDPRVTAEMYALIRKLNREEGITILMISHDLSVALRDATHVLHVGGELFFGTRDAYLESALAAGFRDPRDEAGETAGEKKSEPDVCRGGEGTSQGFRGAWNGQETADGKEVTG